MSGSDSADAPCFNEPDPRTSPQCTFRIAARRGVEREVMDVAHTMLIIGYHMGYHMLKTGETYHERGATYLEQIHKDQIQRHFVKRLQRLGINVTAALPIAA